MPLHPFSPRRLLHVVMARPRLVVAGALGLLTFFLIPHEWVDPTGSRLLLGWNAGAICYLVLAGVMMARSGPEQMRRRALHQDEGRWMILGLVIVAAVAVVFAIGSQLAVVRDLQGASRTGHAALAALTMICSWLFTQLMFALHYAHDFYMARMRCEPDPLSFPGTANPVYLDFLYFACVIGTSGQTADISFSGSASRGTGLVHCVFSFFFNATFLAMAINMAAGLI